MKIRELQISKDVKRYDDPVKILKKHGWTLLGDGKEGAVAEHPNKGYALKLFSSKSRYVQFVNLVKDLQDNPHVPKFGRFVKPVPGSKFSYVRMEKLNPVSDKQLITTYLPEMCEIYLTYENFGVTEGSEHLENSVVRAIGNLHWKEYPNFISDFMEIEPTEDEISELWKLVKRKPDEDWIWLLKVLQHPNLPIDFHEGNFMLRGSTLVITDPFV